MKKLIIFIVIFMNVITINASVVYPTFSITSNSMSKEDIDKMYETKTKLLEDYGVWTKGVDDPFIVLADHEDNYNATYQNGVYTIVLGQGNGKEITGSMQTSYCSTSEDIEKKSWILGLFE